MLKHMKILFVCQNLNSGGAEKVISILSNHFVSKNEVNILMISNNASEPFYELDPRIVVKSIFNIENVNELSKIAKYKAIVKYLKLNHPDVIIPFLDFVTIYTYYASRKLKGTKLIVSERCDPTKVSKMESLIKKHIYKNADGCVFQTEDAKAFYGNKLKAYRIIPNPVSLSTVGEFDYYHLDRKKEIVMVGSKKIEKNRLMAYKAFKMFVSEKQFEDYILRIYGETTEEEDSDVLNKLGIKDKVFFMGRRNTWHQEAIDSTAFILTSDYEGMPNALLEAACLKIPCISTDCPVGGPRFILKNGKKGILVPTNDFASLANELKKIASDKTLQNQYSDANSTTLQEFDKEAICNLWDLFIEEIING